MNKIIVVAGSTGNLGTRIVKSLLKEGAEVRSLVRPTSNSETLNMLKRAGAKVTYVDTTNVDDIAKACKGAHCVVSALAGLRDVVIDAQKVLLDGAIAGGVARFIPSDYSLDFTRFDYGENRNLDLRREFHEYLDRTPIASTSIFNGAFLELITGDMPLILLKRKLILYWGDLDHKLAFTSMDNTAEFTAKVALDDSTPRYLHIAGDQISPREIKDTMAQVTGEKYRSFRPGGLPLLSIMIKIVRKLAGGEDELYPAWQGMQYMRNMIDKRSDMIKLDNNLYPGITWTTVKDIVTEYCRTAKK